MIPARKKTRAATGRDNRVPGPASSMRHPKNPGRPPIEARAAARIAVDQPTWRQAVADAVPHPPELAAEEGEDEHDGGPSENGEHAPPGSRGHQVYRWRKEREVSHLEDADAQPAAMVEVDQEVHGGEVEGEGVEFFTFMMPAIGLEGFVHHHFIE